MSKILVTGGEGFIGGHLVDRLVKDGHEVIVIDDESSGNYKNPGVHTYCNIDITKLDTYMGTALYHPDIVYHLAAVSRTPPAVSDPTRCMEVNAIGTAKVLELARNKGAKRFVNISSNVVLAGPTAYKVSKKAGEELAKVYNDLYGMSTISTRFSNVYGPRIAKGDPAVFSLLRDTYKETGYVNVTGNGEQTRDWTHVYDIVDGLVKAGEHYYSGVVDLCTGRNVTLNYALDLLGVPLDKRIYGPERPGDVKEIIQSPEFARHMLDWEAKIKLEEGITDIWN